MLDVPFNTSLATCITIVWRLNSQVAMFPSRETSVLFGSNQCPEDMQLIELIWRQLSHETLSGRLEPLNSRVRSLSRDDVTTTRLIGLLTSLRMRPRSIAAGSTCHTDRLRIQRIALTMTTNETIHLSRNLIVILISRIDFHILLLSGVWSL